MPSGSAAATSAATPATPNGVITLAANGSTFYAANGAAAAPTAIHANCSIQPATGQAVAAASPASAPVAQFVVKPQVAQKVYSI